MSEPAPEAPPRNKRSSQEDEGDRAQERLLKDLLPDTESEGKSASPRARPEPLSQPHGPPLRPRSVQLRQGAPPAREVAHDPRRNLARAAALARLAANAPMDDDAVDGVVRMSDYDDPPPSKEARQRKDERNRLRSEYDD